MSSTGFVLLDTPNPSYPQCRETRRNGAEPTGTCVVHTAENFIDLIGADSGAEQVSRFIASRDTPGSYHFLCDSDSLVFMAPAWYETWHDTATNNWSYGGSMAVRAGEWDRIPEDRRERIVKNCAAGFASYAKWLLAEHGITIPAERITQAQAHRGEPGFLGHGDSDPGRRTDPGADFDWDLFLDEFARLTDQDAPSKPKPKPAPSGTDWPAQPLPSTDRHTAASHAAWVELLAAVGYKHKDLGEAMQAWLDDLEDPRTGTGYYPMPPLLHDGVMGEYGVKALQRKLWDTKDARGRRLYNGKADGRRLRRTVQAEIKYLNLPQNRGVK